MNLLLEIYDIVTILSIASIALIIEIVIAIIDTPFSYIASGIS